MKGSHIIIISAILAGSFLAGLVILAWEIRGSPHSSKFKEDRWAWQTFGCKGQKKNRAFKDNVHDNRKAQLESMNSLMVEASLQGAVCVLEHSSLQAIRGSFW